MKKLLIVLAIVFLISSIAEKAQAFYVIDTGADPEIGILLNGDYGIAMQFSMGQAYTITSIESVIYNWGDGTMSLAVYGDDADSPDFANELFRQNIFIPAGEHVWRGATGLNLDLDAGTYWASYEAFSGEFVGSLSDGAITPVDRYVFIYTHAYDYAELPADLTLRIEALDEQIHVVPEPATMLLLGSGMVGAFIKRRRKI